MCEGILHQTVLAIMITVSNNIFRRTVSAWIALVEQPEQQHDGETLASRVSLEGDVCNRESVTSDIIAQSKDQDQQTAHCELRGSCLVFLN